MSKMILVWGVGHHEYMSVLQGNIIPWVFHLQMLGLEPSIDHELGHILGLIAVEHVRH